MDVHESPRPQRARRASDVRLRFMLPPSILARLSAALRPCLALMLPHLSALHRAGRRKRVAFDAVISASPLFARQYSRP